MKEMKKSEAATQWWKIVGCQVTLTGRCLRDGKQRSFTLKENIGD